MITALLLGLTLGATSAVHCIAMCGPLTAFVALDPAGATEPSRVVRYQLGRIVGYGTLGAALGGAGAGLVALVPPGGSAILSVALGLSLALAALQIWPRSAKATPLATLGRAPRSPRFVDRARRASASLLARVRARPFGLGVASALLPCGVLGAGALLAAGTGSVVGGALAMSGLALASGLGITLAGVALGRVSLARSVSLARAMAATLAIGAVVLCIRPALVRPEAPVACHAP